MELKVFSVWDKIGHHDDENVDDVSKQINDWVRGRHIVSVTQSSTDGLTTITVVVQ